MSVRTKNLKAPLGFFLFADKIKKAGERLPIQRSPEIFRKPKNTLGSLQKIRSKLHGLLSRRNTASHRSYFKAQGAPPQPGAARCGGLRQQKTGDTTAVPPAKNHFPMSSYGGIIRIRSRVEVELPLSKKLPYSVV